MNLRSSRTLVACAMLLCASAPASAPAQSQPNGNKKKALALYKKAEIQYDLGHWQQAIDLWVEAYETYSAPEFLFNIAQAYRQDDNCERALFFYRRYLTARPKAPNRVEVEGLIRDLEERCKKPPGPAPSPPNGGKGGASPTRPRSEMGPPSAGGAGPDEGGPPMAEAVGRNGERGGQGGGDVRGGPDDVRGGPDEGDQPDQSIEGEVGPGRPRLFAIRAAAGPSFPSLGPLDVGTLASFTLGVGHPIYIGSVVLEPGALVTYTPIPWDAEDEDGMHSGTAGLIGILADLGLSYEFIPRLSGRVDVGAGLVLFSGLRAEGNPFLEERDVLEDGSLIRLFGARVALGGEYAITDNFLIHAQPLVFSYSPTKDLRDDIDKITRFEILVGAGFRM